MGRRAADHEEAVFQLDLAQIRNRLDIDEVLIAQKIVFHGEQQLCPPGVGACFLTQLTEHCRCLSDCLRLMNRETSKGHHKLKLFQLFKHSKRSNRHKAQRWRCSILNPPLSTFCREALARLSPA